MTAQLRGLPLRWWRAAVTAAVCACLLPALVGAQEQRLRNGEVRVGFVATGGNSETETLTLRAKFGLRSERSRVGLEGGGLQTRTTSFRRFAERSPGGELVLVEEPSTSLSAERYWARFHFRHRMGPFRTFWFGRLEWDRNEPAGIRNRYTGLGGLGNDWIDRERMHFWTEYGYTFNRERRNIEGLPRAVNYPGLRFEWEFEWQFARTSKYRNELQVNQNLDDTADLRAEMEQELEVEISERFAVILGLELFYDDDPPFNRVPVLEQGSRTGEFLLVPFDELDSYFTASLVFRF